ncbi:MFS transporter [Frankia sp. CNm7]|uniref:MFS transporter n=2 Tax=Frankia nepalensis TaxID=1836974 RepID=A0A937USU4_9ACTN|nr:MFS transporter [Frankia nepalensis]MBL7510850.1 MFS transporter [Frankia nepalensis]MBL7522323.1 MFS transporter [Frankia nepalensis]MBL7630585.1 MFS transporter [Frankia nepalensis]
MTQREIDRAVWALVLGLFVTMISATVVSNALPHIIGDLHGSSTDYTWVVATTLLLLTATTPVWGKLADLLDKKMLLMVGLAIFTVGSALGGFAHSPQWLIAARAIQGIGAGGTSALVQVAIAAMVPARERARYNGYTGSAYAISTLSGPLVGGLIVDTPWLGWRWCFFFCVPVAAAALVVLARTLRLPDERRPVNIDYFGAALIPGGVGLLLLWLTLGGDMVEWLSGTGLAMLLGGVAALAIAVVVESRVAEPIVPLRLFRERTIVLAVVGSVATGGVTMTVPMLFSQYFQLGRGLTPTVSGLLTAPMVCGLAVSGNVAGRAIARTGRWKRILVGGALFLIGGLALFSTIRATTPLVAVAAYLALVGVGIGMTQQNLIVAAQNSAPRADLGAASATVSFFRSLGATAGIAALGAMYGDRAAHLISGGLAAAGLPAGSVGTGVPRLADLPAPVAAVVENAYGDALGQTWLVAVPLAVVTLVAVLLIRETRLHTGDDLEAADTLTQPPLSTG